MLFDNINNSKSTNIKNVSESNSDFFYTFMNKSILDLNEDFFNISKEILLKEAFSKSSNYPFLIMNETVSDSFAKINNHFNSVFGDLDKAVNTFSIKINSALKEDSKFINKYRNDFLDAPKLSALMNTYTLDNLQLNYSVIDKIITDYKVDFRKLTLDKVKNFSRNDDYFEKLRAEVIGVKGKLTDSEFKHLVYKKLRNNNENPKNTDLNDRLKLQMIQDIVKTNYDDKNIKEESNKIKRYIRLNLEAIKEQIKYISKDSSIDKLNYDNYTTLIYNEINELREVLRMYLLALSMKIDAVKLRRDEYMTIFTNVIEGSFEKLKVSKYNSILREDNFLINEYEFSNEIYKLESKNITLFAMNETLNFSEETIMLYSEGILDNLNDIVKKIKEGLEKVRNMIINHKPDFIDKFIDEKVVNSLKATVQVVDDSDLEKAISVYEIRTDLIEKTLSSFQDIEKVEKDISQYDKEDEFYAHFFPQISSTHEKDEEWKDTVRRYFQGKYITNVENAIERTVFLTNSKTNDKITNLIGDTYKKLESFTNVLQNEGNKAKQEKTKDEMEQKRNQETKQQIQNSSYDFFSEDENDKNIETRDAAIEKVRTKIENGSYDAVGRDSDNNDFNNGTPTGSGKYDEAINQLKHYITRLSTITGLASSVFTDGQAQANSSMTLLGEIQNKAKKPETEQEKEQNKVEKEQEERK